MEGVLVSALGGLHGERTVAYEAGILRFTFFGLFAIHSIVPGVVDLCRTPGLAAEGIDVIVF